MLFLLRIFSKSIFLTKHTLEIRSCTGDNGLCLPDATMHPVKSTTDVLNLMKLGEVNVLSALPQLATVVVVPTG